MPTIHKIFLLKLLVALAAICGLLFGIHAIQAGRIPDALKRQAERAIDANKTDTAVHYLRQYLEFCPTDVDVQERLANILRSRSTDTSRSELVFLYDKILRGDPSRAGIRKEAIALCLKFGRFTDASNHAEAFLKDTPSDAAVWQQLALAQIGQRTFDDADKSFRTSLQFDPKEPTTYSRFAEFLVREQKRPGEAKIMLDRMVSELPNLADSYVMRARFAIATQGDAVLPAVANDSVIRDLKQAISLAPKTPEPRLLLAERYQRQRAPRDAHDVLAEGLKQTPNDIRMIRSLAWLESHRGHIPQAITVLEDGITATRDTADLLIPLGDLLLQSGDTEKALEVLAKLEKRRGPLVKLQIKYLRGRLAMHAGKWSEAIEMLSELRSESAELPLLEAQSNLLLANCHRRLAEPAKERECLKLILAKDPSNIAARAMLGQAFLNAGQLTEAIREYELAAQNPAGAGTYTATVIQMKALRLAATNAASDAWTKFETEAVASLKKGGVDTADSVLILADVAYLSGKPGAALNALERERSQRPGDVRLWTKLTERIADVRGVAAGLAILDEAQGAMADSVELRLARAELYARDPVGLRPIPMLESQIESWPDIERNRLCAGLIDIYERKGDRADALRLHHRIATETVRDAALWQAVAMRAIEADDTAILAQAKTALKAIEGDAGAYQIIVATAVAVKSGNAATWIASRDALTAKFGANPTSADACLALGTIADRLGDMALSVQFYARAFALEPTRVEAVKGLLRFHAIKGNAVELKAMLLRLSIDPRWASEPFQRVVWNVASTIERPAATRLFAACPVHLERLAGHLGWLADCWQRIGQTAEAQAIRTRAVQVPGANVDDYVRLQVDIETTRITELAKQKLDERAYATLLATIDAAAKIKRERTFDSPTTQRMYIRERFAIMLARMERTNAIELLQGYLNQPNEPQSDRAWATQNLTMLLAVRGETADRRRAAALLISQRDLFQTAEERRAVAGVLSSLHRYLDGTDRTAALERAISLLAEIAKETNSPRDMFILSQAYRAGEKTNEAVNCLQMLLNRDPTNVEYLIVAMEVLIEGNQYDAAKAFAERLLVRGPNDSRIVTSVANYYCKAGQYERAIAMIESDCKEIDRNGNETYETILAAAELYDRLSRLPQLRGTAAVRMLTDAAVAKYDRLLPTRAEYLTRIASLLATDRRPEEAFAKIQSAKTLNPRTKALAGVAAVRNGATDVWAARVREWVQTARAQEPDSILLCLTEADYYTIRNDFTAAEKAYQQVLTIDPRNAVALNNLAWLLAPMPERATQANELIERAMKEKGLTGELLDTRARIRISAKQYELAEKDAAEALRYEKTAMRYFHLSVAMNSQKKPDADRAFREAKSRGLEPIQLHPADRESYRRLDEANRSPSLGMPN